MHALQPIEVSGILLNQTSVKWMPNKHILKKKEKQQQVFCCKLNESLGTKCCSTISKIRLVMWCNCNLLSYCSIEIRKKRIMGCGESKIKEISLTPEIQMNGKSESNMGYEQCVKPTAIVNPNYDETTFLPNRLLAAIPVSDLGDSLDSRHLSESLNLSHGFGLSFKMDNNDKVSISIKFVWSDFNYN